MEEMLRPWIGESVTVAMVNGSGLQGGTLAEVAGNALLLRAPDGNLFAVRFEAVAWVQKVSKLAVAQVTPRGAVGALQ